MSRLYDPDLLAEVDRLRAENEAYMAKIELLHAHGVRDNQRAYRLERKLERAREALHLDAGNGWRRIQAALADTDPTASEPCTWTPDEDGVWATTCGNLHVFETGGPADNRYQHCPYCGRRLVEAASDGGDDGMDE